MNDAFQRGAEAFVRESTDLLVQLEETLLELDQRRDELDLVAQAFRALHTIKGAASMFDRDDVADFTHDIENLFDRLRHGQLNLNDEIIRLSLASCDHLRELLTVEDPGTVDAEDATQRILEPIRKLLPDEGEGEAPSSSGEEGVVVDQGVHRTWLVRFQPAPDLLAKGTNPALLFDELLELGEVHLRALTDEVPPLSEMEPDQCYFGWEALVTTTREEGALRDVFIFVEEGATLEVSSVVEEEALGDKSIQEVLEGTSLSPTQVKAVESHWEELIKKIKKANKAKAAGGGADGGQKAGASKGGSGDLRVSADKINTLVDLVGELVIAQSRLSQAADRHGDLELVSIAEDLERLSAELRDTTLNVRMLMIGTTFNRFRRLVFDLSRELGKEIELITEGAETELDKTVIERLADPLVHLIRNSIDHGIEKPEVREESGKSRTGTIRLSAEHSGGRVVIRIEDDGAGLNVERIRAKAIERRLITESTELSDKATFNLIFQAGFSTAETISSISGRGVGMDVVKTSIEDLGGKVEIDSEEGKGTSIVINLPLTLAIIDGLLVDVDGGAYVIPLSVVEECIDLDHETSEDIPGRRLTEVRGELVPYVRLREWFEVYGESPEVEQVVITCLDGKRFGFVVDNVVGQHQTVIKSLGKVYQGLEGFSGATILGNGSVALILDAAKLAHAVEDEGVLAS